MSTVVTDSPRLPEVSAGTRVSVSGMTCQNCARHVREAISSVPGVSAASVDVDQASATVRWAAEVEPDVNAVVRAVNAAGYQASVSVTSDAVANASARLLSGWTLNLVLGVPVT